jgi:hypothetical protein
LKELAIGWGRCPCCGLKTDLTKDHVKDDAGKRTGDSIMICGKCHTIIENHRREVAEMRKAKKTIAA